MPDVDNSPGEPNDIPAQIARLREQVDALMKDRVTPATGDGTVCSEIAVCCSVVKVVQQQAEELSGRIRERPLMALLIAASVGFVLGRAIR